MIVINVCHTAHTQILHRSYANQINPSTIFDLIENNEQCQHLSIGWMGTKVTINQQRKRK